MLFRSICTWHLDIFFLCYPGTYYPISTTFAHVWTIHDLFHRVFCQVHNHIFLNRLSSILLIWFLSCCIDNLFLNLNLALFWTYSHIHSTLSLFHGVCISTLFGLNTNYISSIVRIERTNNTFSLLFWKSFDFFNQKEIF